MVGLKQNIKHHLVERQFCLYRSPSKQKLEKIQHQVQQYLFTKDVNIRNLVVDETFALDIQFEYNLTTYPLIITVGMLAKFLQIDEKLYVLHLYYICCNKYLVILLQTDWTN